MDDLVLKIEDVGKDYMLGAVTGQTFKDARKIKVQMMFLIKSLRHWTMSALRYIKEKQ